MRLITIASGSRGNCALVTGAGGHLLIDAGISTRRISLALRELGLEFSDLSGVLITHDHQDHIQGLQTFVKRSTVPIYAPRRVAGCLCRSVAGVEPSLQVLAVGEEQELGSFVVRPFFTPHDTEESVGYRIDSVDGSLGYATDTGVVTDAVLEGLAGVETAVIEANHDVEMLRRGSYPAFLKRRILSDRGHLSNENCGRLAAELVGTGTRRLVLAHLSQENNTPALARSVVSEALAATGRQVTLEVAPAADPLCVEWTRGAVGCSV